MLALLRKRKDIGGGLVYKLDRLSRNLSDYSSLEEMEGVALLSATESIPDGASGRFIATIHAAVSRLYSDQLGERVKHAALMKVQQGGWPGPAPTGYLNDTELKTLVPDPEMAPIVVLVFEIYAYEDISLSQLVVRARSLGLRTKNGGVLSKGALHHLLTNPIYCGMVRYDGNLYPGNHRALISRDLFDRVQERLSKKSSSLTKRAFPYRGLMTCGYCGCRITASLIKGKYVYYHCTRGRGACSQAFFREESIGELFQPVVERIHMPPSLIEKLLSDIRDLGNRRQANAAARMRSIEGKLVELEEMRSRGYEDKLKGRISERRWIEMDRRWSEQEDCLRNEVAHIEEGQGPAEDEAEAVFKLLQRAPRLYQSQSPVERARFLRTLLSNSLLEGGRLEPIYNEPFDMVAEGVDRSSWLPVEDYLQTFHGLVIPADLIAT